jgi:hypothetical protein
MQVLTLFLLPEPEQGLTVALVSAAGSAFSQTGRFYPVQLPVPYPLAELWYRQHLVCGALGFSSVEAHLPPVVHQLKTVHHPLPGMPPSSRRSE